MKQVCKCVWLAALHEPAYVLWHYSADGSPGDYLLIGIKRTTRVPSGLLATAPRLHHQRCGC